MRALHTTAPGMTASTGIPMASPITPSSHPQHAGSTQYGQQMQGARCAEHIAHRPVAADAAMHSSSHACTLHGSMLNTKGLQAITTILPKRGLNRLYNANPEQANTIIPLQLAGTCKAKSLNLSLWQVKVIMYLLSSNQGGRMQVHPASPSMMRRQWQLHT